MQAETKCNVGTRLLMAGALLACLFAPHEAEANDLVIASWGGTYRQATQANIAAPFEKETGTKATYIDAGGGWAAKIQAQFAASKVQWDLVDGIDAGSAEFLFKSGMLEPLPDELRKKMETVSIPGTVTAFGIEQGSSGILVVCRADFAKCPSTPAQFFDPVAFPGARAILSEAHLALPFAAVAGGQDPKHLFPVNLDTAFDMLRKVKSAVRVWTTSGDQQQQVLRSGEVDMALMWNGRAYNLARNGTPLKLQWNGALLDPGYLVVLKGAPNKDKAFKYLEYYATHPEHQAAFAKVIGYGIAHKDVGAMLPPEVNDALPSSHPTIRNDARWYAENRQEIQKRWQEFLASK
jgi:spermidine/putrescine-binding protein